MREAEERGVIGTDLRRVMGAFATGVAVVTTESDGRPQGMTVNSLTSVSLDPPLLLVCLTRGARTTEALLQRGLFAVNILSARQEEVSNRFARRGEDHFEGLPTVHNERGLPIIPKALATLECAVEEVHRGGDHEIVVGRVLQCSRDDRSPLLFFGGRYFELGAIGGSADWYW
jgi:flavin reductase (DIM6/NTAB) family NADH-FMN oxidoreductase RutF